MEAKRLRGAAMAQAAATEQVAESGSEVLASVTIPEGIPTSNGARWQCILWYCSMVFCVLSLSGDIGTGAEQAKAEEAEAEAEAEVAAKAETARAAAEAQRVRAEAEAESARVAAVQEAEAASAAAAREAEAAAARAAEAKAAADESARIEQEKEKQAAEAQALAKVHTPPLPCTMHHCDLCSSTACLTGRGWCVYISWTPSILSLYP